MEVGVHRRTIHQEDNQNSPENSEESPPSPLSHDTKATSTSSTNRRRGAKKRVVYVPINESRLKGETNAPPSDSWAWRKYGQKPIKGSPYPRGYYRCSSSKGCPARKQVERSQTDPTMVMVTYSCEHNHPWPASKNKIHHYDTPPSPPSTTEATTSDITNDQLEEADDDPAIPNRRQLGPEPEQAFTSLEVGSSCGLFSTTTNQYYEWLSDLDSTSPTMLESPMMAEDSDMATTFSIRDDEESFFADLGELPECTTVFRRRERERVEEHRRKLAPWCGTTG